MLGSGACSSDCHPRLHTEPIWPGRAQVQQSQIQIQSTIANTSVNTNPYDQVLLLLLTCSHPHLDPHHLAQGLSEATSSRSWRLDPTGFGEVVVVAGSAPSSLSWSRWWSWWSMMNDEDDNDGTISILLYHRTTYSQKVSPNHTPWRTLAEMLPKSWWWWY